MDFSASSLNETPLRTLLQRNHRAVFYVADYEQMTGYPPSLSLSHTPSSAPPASPYYALDSCLIDNQLGNPSGPAAVEAQRALYAAADERKAKDMADQRLYLVSLVGGMDYVYAALLKFGKLDLIPHDEEELIAQCAATFNVNGMAWCPETLLDGSQLANYYTQVAMDELLQQMLMLQAGNSDSNSSTTGGLPHAIYINAVGSLDGTIRTGTEVLWGKNRSPQHPEHAQQGFAYVDSFLLYNVLRECNGQSHSTTSSATAAACQSLTDLLVQRRAQYPLALWDDATYGRLTSW